MCTTYIFIPKNPNLNHCPESFYQALYSKSDCSNNLQRIHRVNLETCLYFFQTLKNLKSGEYISLFFFALQLDYVFLISFLRIIRILIPKEIKVYYMMHEPKLEIGRVNPIKALLVNFFNLLLGYLSSKVFLPSNEAVVKAKSFVENHKISQINLTFISIPDKILESNFSQLKCNWNNLKTFSYIGTAYKDKNPQGFISFAAIIHKYYGEVTRCIRAGAEKNIRVNYDEELIVRFPGYVSPNAKNFLLGLTHFLVIPYSVSTQSGVIPEALSYGKPLILNDIPAFYSLKGLKFIFMIDFNDENSIISCINYLMSMDADDYNSRCWEAVKYFRENHSIEYLSKSLNNI
ncbi:MAG: glycosyltransferase [Scytonematopsis contorta HA4267-MV1]|jgi:glycosyltransferase involved in cell wall biosynthesis|nr:glycosyltransferase [Scytonematopsis contorta HA4267-MV1]